MRPFIRSSMPRKLFEPWPQPTPLDLEFPFVYNGLVESPVVCSRPIRLPRPQLIRKEDGMFTRRSMLVAPFLAAALAPLSVEASADDYPSGPVTLMVSFPPGGSLDVVARAMAPKLQERLGKPVVIENRTGASGALAAAAVAK